MLVRNDLKTENMELWELRKGKPTELKVFGYVIAIRDEIPSDLDILQIFKMVSDVIDIDKTKAANDFKLIESETRTGENLKKENVELWELRKGKPTELKVFGFIVAIRDEIPSDLEVINLFEKASQVIDIEKTKVANNFKLVEPKTGIEKSEEREETGEVKNALYGFELENTESVITAQNNVPFQDCSPISMDSNLRTESLYTQKIKETENPFGYHNRNPVFLSKIHDLYTLFPKGFTSIQAKDMFVKAYPEIMGETAISKCRCHLLYLVNNGYLEITEKYNNISRFSRYRWLIIPPGIQNKDRFKIDPEYLKVQRALGLEKLRSGN